MSTLNSQAIITGGHLFYWPSWQQNMLLYIYALLQSEWNMWNYTCISNIFIIYEWLRGKVIHLKICTNWDYFTFEHLNIYAICLESDWTWYLICNSISVTPKFYSPKMAITAKGKVIQVDLDHFTSDGKGIQVDLDQFTSGSNDSKVIQVRLGSLYFWQTIA